jgi:hypothetical protein
MEAHWQHTFFETISVAEVKRRQADELQGFLDLFFGQPNVKLFSQEPPIDDIGK